MIHLVEAALSYHPPGGTMKTVFFPTTLDIPIDRRLAILGGRRNGKSSLLRLFAGAEMPSYGAIVSSARMSPVIKPGAFFGPKLTIYENLRFYARMFNLEAEQLVAIVSSVCGPELSLGREVGDEPRDMRTMAELALITVLPFDCYLVDDVIALPEAARRLLFLAAEQRQAGVIFATNQIGWAAHEADCAVVIRDKMLHPFSDIQEAVAFHER
jgi:capsular polysaccharide transport system ATP-binding protein